MARCFCTLLLLLISAAAVSAQSSSEHSALVDTLLAMHEANRPDRIESLATPAIEEARAAGDSVMLARLLLIRGATRAGFGHARQAESDLREGAALGGADADTLSRLQFQRWLGVAVGRQGRAAEATALYAELASMAEAAGDSLHLGWAWVGLAYGHYLDGRAAEAGDLYARAAGVLGRRGETAGAIWAWNGRALVMRQTGRFREARDAFTHLLALAEEAGDPVNAATALDQLGRLDMLLGDPGRAVEHFRRSAAIHRASWHDREGLVPCIDLAAARVMQGRWADAEAALDSVLIVCRELGFRDLEVLAESQLVDAWLAQGRPGAVVDRCREMLARGEMPSRLSATETRLRLARALADRDSLVAATTLLEDVLAGGAGAVTLELRASGLLGGLLVDQDRPRDASRILRSAVAIASGAGNDADLVTLLTHLGRAETALGHPDSALVIYTRAIACWEGVRARPADLEWREHWASISGSLFAHAIAAKLDSSDGPAEAWAWAQRHKARTLQERMLGPVAEATAPAAPALTDFREQVLRPGDVLLDIVEGERSSVFFCVTRDTAFAGTIPGRRGMAHRLRRLVDVLTSPSIDDSGPALRLVAEVMADWPDEARRLAAKAETVWWCPDGAWHAMPAALPDWPGVSTRIPSAGVLARLREQPESAIATASILAVTGPDPEGGGPLPGAARETAWLASRLRGVSSPPSATVVDHALLADADVLHFAAHTLLDAHQPWNTSITLGRDPDEVLKAVDVAGLDLRARLVVLAGCTTAGVHRGGGEGLIGLAGAFTAARTPAVLATLWPVDDAIALHVTTTFYEGLADGLTAAAALDGARRACRADPVMRAPRHWAAFVLVGDGDVTVPVERRASHWRRVAGLGTLVVVALVLARRRNSPRM